MWKRCTNPRNRNFHNYGGRGIGVCERWKSFENFLTDMGERPTRLSLDRVNVNGNYEPGNCRWATSKVQRRNTREKHLSPEQAENIRRLAATGEHQRTLAKRFGVSKGTITNVVKRRGMFADFA